MAFEFLESIDSLKEYSRSVYLIMTKNRFWFSDELNRELDNYVSYFFSLQYACEAGFVRPNKLMSNLLAFDFYKMRSKINKEIKNCHHMTAKSGHFK